MGGEPFGAQFKSGAMISFTASLKLWRSDEGSSHFVTVPPEHAGEIKAHALMVKRGFGSVKVEVRVDDVTWRTSIFPSKDGGYFLPIKIAVVRSTGKRESDLLEITMDLI
ncbi:MAG TPA: DUF1905 domain-containing protein [Sphingomicrobium sp.]|nr:DUF1905 domain-containing protein [Sphingomicrobium sp.]